MVLYIGDGRELPEIVRRRRSSRQNPARAGDYNDDDDAYYRRAKSTLMSASDANFRRLSQTFMNQSLNLEKGKVYLPINQLLHKCIDDFLLIFFLEKTPLLGKT